MPDEPAICPSPDSPTAGCRIARMSTRFVASILDAVFLATVCAVAVIAIVARGTGFTLAAAPVWPVCFSRFV